VTTLDGVDLRLRTEANRQTMGKGFFEYEARLAGHVQRQLKMTAAFSDLLDSWEGGTKKWWWN